MFRSRQEFRRTQQYDAGSSSSKDRVQSEGKLTLDLTQTFWPSVTVGMTMGQR